jgi:hypothetical protein
MRPRLLRILLNAATVLSILLFIAAVGLWSRSYFVPDVLCRLESWTDGAPTTRLSYLWIVSSAGQLRVSETDGFMLINGPTIVRRWSWSRDVPPATKLPDSFLTRRGLLFAHVEEGGPRHQWKTRLVGAPYWVPTSLFALFSTLGLRRMHRNSRARVRGSCPACGYDLRATPDRCPECGQLQLTGSLL